MSKKFSSGFSYRKIVTVFSITILALLIIAVIYSILMPYDRFGYKTLVNDNTNKTYSSGERFEYGPYEFQIEIKERDVKPRLLTCDGDNYVPLSGELIMSQEECLEHNGETRNEFKSLVYIDTTYKIKGISGVVLNLPDGWLKIYDSRGQKIIAAHGGLSVSPSVVISKTVTKRIDRQQAKPVTAVLTLPSRAQQTIIKE